MRKNIFYREKKMMENTSVNLYRIS